MSGLVLLASYPKSGNTWVRLALQALGQGRAPVDINARGAVFPIITARNLFDQVLDVDSCDLTPDEIERARPRFHERLAREAASSPLYKVHDAFTVTGAGEPLFPPAAIRAVIYVCRDPRDVAVSLAHHLEYSIDRSIAAMADPAFGLAPAGGRLSQQLPQRLGDWSKHVEGWLDAPGVDVHLLRYEDLLRDPCASLTRVSAVAGMAADEAMVRRVVEATRFERLQSQEQAEGFRERAYPQQRFFREGQAGGWRHRLSPEQARRIEHSHGRVMRRLGYLD